MAVTSMNAIKQAFELINNYDESKVEKIKDAEHQTDIYEDALGTYLVKLSSQTYRLTILQKRLKSIPDW